MNLEAENRYFKWALFALLAAATIAVYSVSISNGFVWDDDFIIVSNPATRQLPALHDLLFSPDVVKPYYRPLNRASYLLDFQLFGMNPAAYHAVNLAIHLLNVLLLYLLGRRLFEERIPALLAALLFAVHPLNAESVNFISARNNLLAMFFGVSSLLLFLRGSERGRMRWLLPSALLFFGALLSKETGLMVALPILLHTVRPLPGAGDEPWSRRLASLLPYLAVFILYLLMRGEALGDVAGFGSVWQGLGGRLALNYYLIPQYLGLFLFPAGLTIFHEVPQSGIFGNPLLAVAWVLIIPAVWYLLLRGGRVAVFGLVWFAAFYLPVSNIVPLPSPMAERFLYLPLAGLALIAGGYLWRLARAIPARRFAIVALAVVLLPLAVVTVQRSLDWRSDITLFGSVLRTDPASLSGHFNLGSAFRDRGDLVSAQREWEAALRIDPTYAEALAQLGTLWAVRGNLQMSERYYLAALRSRPGLAMAHLNLGKIAEMKRRPDLALLRYQLFLKYASVDYNEYLPEVAARVARLKAALRP